MIGKLLRLIPELRQRYRHRDQGKDHGNIERAWPLWDATGLLTGAQSGCEESGRVLNVVVATWGSSAVSFQLTSNLSVLQIDVSQVDDGQPSAEFSLQGVPSSLPLAPAWMAHQRTRPLLAS